MKHKTNLAQRLVLLLTVLLVGTLSNYAASATTKSATSVTKNSAMASIDNSLVIWHKDGSMVMLILEEMPKVVFEGDMVKASSATVSVEYEFEAIQKITYGELSANKIQAVEADGTRPFETSDKSITFMPGSNDLKVEIISAGGVVMKQMTVKSGQPTTMSLNEFTNGVYLVVVNGVTYKINVR